MLISTSKRPAANHGFALVIALSLMAFVLLLLLSITTLVQVETTSATTLKSQTLARQNARLGLIMAIGELQKQMGPDQRISARAAIFEPGSDGTTTGIEIYSPQWVGAWNTQTTGWLGLDHDERLTRGNWLVSGNTGLAPTDPNYITPSTNLDAYPSNQVATVQRDTSVSPTTEIKVLKESLPDNESHHFAYWISDENTKARVDLIDPDADSTSHAKLTTALATTRRSGIERLDQLDAYPANDSLVSKIVDLASTVFISKSSSASSTSEVIEDHYFNSLTPWSQGLLVDVKNGGLKRDLTQAFEYRKIFDKNFVVSPEDGSDQEALHFIDDDLMIADGIDGVDASGPNWSILRSYYRQYIPGSGSPQYGWIREDADGAELKSALRVDIEEYREFELEVPDYVAPFWSYARDYGKDNYRMNKYLGWQHNLPNYSFSPHASTGLPYQTPPSYQGKENGNDDRLFFPMSDNYQLQSWVTPLIARLQFSYALREGDEGLEMVVTPVIGIYNPYNTEIYLNRLVLGWAPNLVTTITVDGEDPVNFGIRELMPDAADGRVSLFIHDKDTGKELRFRPGETRYFGIDKNYSKYDPIRQSENGIAMFWRKSSGSPEIEISENESRPVYLTNYVAGAGGMVIPLKLRMEFMQNNSYGISEASQEGVTPIIRYQDGSYSPNRPTKQKTWGFTQSEMDRLAKLELLETDSGLYPGFNFEIKLEEDIGSGMTLGYGYSGSVLSIGKIFADAKGSDAISVSRYYNSVASANLQDELLSIGYWLKTTEEYNAPWRNLIDSNVRAIASNVEWDGFTDSTGYKVLSTYTTQDPNGSRGVLTSGASDIHLADKDRATGYWGTSIEPGGSSEVILFDRPRTALLSLGNLQHANLGRYNFDPSYMLGNSFANVRIELDQTESSAHSAWIYYSDLGKDPDYENFKLFDSSYLVNEKVWDRYYFSGITSTITEDEVEDFLSGDSSFANTRYTYDPDTAVITQDLLDARGEDDSLFHKMAASLRVEGAFNVNSTSVDAWKAVLGGLMQARLPTYDYSSGEDSEDGGLLISRFSWPYHGKVNLDLSTGSDNFWKGVREISADELNDLAQAIVDQVKLRGPFLSLADFVNRSLKNDDTGKMGALQAALDDPKRGLNTNAKLSSYGDTGPTAIGTGFSDPFSDTNSQAAGMPGYVLQADLLQRIGPILTARGDTFLIRAYGEYTDPISGQTMSEAWCEAIVQRTPLPVDVNITASPEELIQPSGELGRGYEIVSFRWLNESEI
ncbi:hypothetical protein QEH52_04385 [Coraliomargarita sp. SDUM461003]|uniref:Type 4 fimbrial biogenesis protein PilX N-terminal domain-containing protein n=1 Tax=Thalassobacterium maritimum TaxID=3041265 RepID=A0ABU1ARE9_9BACT|nr:hypothetical protein [Coraliomargarita sp. SDUM461003]MDQ8206734.1 hypothetical protein [Coraliomargarita sp. SDUM461003]